jgi:hypothetical protein
MEILGDGGGAVRAASRGEGVVVRVKVRARV